MSDPDGKLDSVFLNARREFWAILVIWAAFCVWVVGVSWWLGHSVDAEHPRTTLGMPPWIFWGVALPWVMANVVTVWFCLSFMADDPLGETEALAEDREPEAASADSPKETRDA